MTAFVDNSSLHVSERNSMAITLIDIQSHIPFEVDTHLNLWSGLRTGRSANFTRDQFTSDPLPVNLLSEKYQAKSTHVNDNRVFRRDREPSRIPEATLKRLRRREGAYSSKHTKDLYVKVRRVTKNVCKLHTKRVKLNKVVQHEKKYLLNCFVRIYERIIKLEYRRSRYLSMLACNKPMCLYKRQTHVSNYCKFQPRGGGYSQKNLVGVYGPLPKTLTLFMNKTCDFPYTIYNLTKNLIPYL